MLLRFPLTPKSALNHAGLIPRDNFETGPSQVQVGSPSFPDFKACRLCASPRMGLEKSGWCGGGRQSNHWSARFATFPTQTRDAVACLEVVRPDLAEVQPIQAIYRWVLLPGHAEKPSIAFGIGMASLLEAHLSVSWAPNRTSHSGSHATNVCAPNDKVKPQAQARARKRFRAALQAQGRC